MTTNAAIQSFMDESDPGMTFDADGLNQPIMVTTDGGYDAYVPPMLPIDDVGAHPHP